MRSRPAVLMVPGLHSSRRTSAAELVQTLQHKSNGNKTPPHALSPISAFAGLDLSTSSRSVHQNPQPLGRHVTQHGRLQREHVVVSTASAIMPLYAPDVLVLAHTCMCFPKSHSLLIDHYCPVACLSWRVMDVGASLCQWSAGYIPSQIPKCSTHVPAEVVRTRGQSPGDTSSALEL